MAIRPFPGQPPTTADPASFDARADATFAHLTLFVADANDLQQDVNNKAAAVAQQTLTAQQAANAAQQAVLDAAAVAGATKWASGATYQQGAVTWSPANFLNYRRKVAGSGTVDPATDATNWILMGAPLSEPLMTITANTLASAGLHYLISANLQLSLPTSPTVRETVRFTNVSGLITSTINPGGNLIRGVSGVMVLDSKSASGLLVFSGATKGWI